MNTAQPMTIEQFYVNAENFLRMQGAKIIAEKINDYAKRLSEDEKAFVESMIKTMN